MSVKERLLAIRLSKKLKKHPDYAEKLGVKIDFKSIKK